MINWISFNGQRKKKTKGSNLFLHLLIRKTESQTEPLPYFRFLIVSPIYQETKNMQYPKPSHKFVGIVTATIDLEEVLAAFLPVVSPYAKKESVWMMNRMEPYYFNLSIRKWFCGTSNSGTKLVCNAISLSITLKKFFL